MIGLESPSINPYKELMLEYAGWVFGEQQAIGLKGQWNSVFGNPRQPLDLEIGCGNGFFFEHQVQSHPQRNLLGIEIKYKPLIQSVRRVRRVGLENGRGLRIKAEKISAIFQKDELDQIFIFFPDPWPKRRHQKNRLLKKSFFEMLLDLQKRDQYIVFKTDSENYFDFVREQIQDLPLEVLRYTRDLHKSEWASENFPTAFEKIFLRQGLPIYHMLLQNKKVQS